MPYDGQHGDSWKAPQARVHPVVSGLTAAGLLLVTLPLLLLPRRGWFERAYSATIARVLSWCFTTDDRARLDDID